MTSPHSWRTSQGITSTYLSCARCGAQTNNALLADIHNNCPVGDVTPTGGLIGVEADEGNAIEIAAGLYLLDNELRPESEWDPLSVHLTAEDITRAKRRLEERRARNRIGAAKVEHLHLPKARQQFICITQACQAVSDRPGACEKCQSDIAAGKFDRLGWETVLGWALVALSLAVSAALVWKEFVG